MKVVGELKFWLNAYQEVKAATDEVQLAFDLRRRVLYRKRSWTTTTNMR